MNSSSGTTHLFIGGVGSVAVAVAHVVAIFIGASAYRFMGAPQLATLVEQGSTYPAAITSGLVIMFLLWALYAFSAADFIRRLPLLRIGLVVIGSIYVLRGLVLCIDLFYLFRGSHPAPRMAAFSAISLLIGLFYLIGTLQFFRVQRAVGAA